MPSILSTVTILSIRTRIRILIKLADVELLKYSIVSSSNLNTFVLKELRKVRNV